VVQMNHKLDTSESRVKIYRWYYYLALTQFLLYFMVPMLIFPGRVIKDIEVISALTLGLLLGLFFLLVSVLGLFLDRKRRARYIASASVIAVYFLCAFVSWSYIEHLDFLLR
jgi:drug/metabolite transporter (DMT)-like permease